MSEQPSRPNHCYNEALASNLPIHGLGAGGWVGPRLLLVGNITVLLITIGAFLQQLSWPIAGLSILSILTLTTLLYGNSQRRGINLHTSQTTTKLTHERILVRPAPHRQSQQPEHRPQLKQVKPKEAASNPPTPNLRFAISLTKPTPPVSKLPPPSPKVLSPITKQPPLTIKPQPTLTVPSPALLKSLLPIQTKPKESIGEKLPIIKEGDYRTYDLDLDKGKEVVADVSANGIVNAYVLTQENLTSLDMGQEFWNETGSEEVQSTTLRFTAPEKGKWFLVVENADSKDVSASVKIRMNQTSSQGPVL